MTVVAALDKKNSQAPLAVKSMLSAVRAPGYRYSLGWRGHVDASLSVEDLPEPRSSVALGIAEESDAPASGIVSRDRWCAALEGYLLPGRDTTHGFMEKSPRRFMEALTGREGAFSCIAAAEVLTACRDELGRAPLYAVEDERWLLLATRKRCIWGNSSREPEIVPPAKIVRFTGRGTHVSRGHVRWPRHARTVTLRDAARRVANLLLGAVGRWSSGLESSALAFSGGLDSGLLGHLTRDLVTLRLITVTFAEGGAHLDQAEKAASILGLPIKLVTPSKSETEKTLRDVVWSCETDERMSVETALPIFCASRDARDLGFDSILTGHVADELFGGYMKYAALSRDDASVAFQRMRADFLNLQRRDLERDFKACASNSLALRLPYSDTQLARYVLSLPTDLRVDVDSGARKLVLREAAGLLGCPQQIVDARKKAVQYSTGASKMLRIIAREHNQPPDLYLRELLRAAKRSARSQSLL
ncbi:MAG: asparagine synthase-related protein [Aigarchaeota archaeon]|nr:asparagine synthase-related protein [Aigarchaeota archaeon]